MSAPSTTSSPATVNAPQSAIDQSVPTYACVLCSQRKIKCDKLQPCSRCVKSRAECIYRAPDPPKRRKRKEPDSNEELRSQLQEYERLLKQAGINVKSATGSSEKTPSSWHDDQAADELAQPERPVLGKGHLVVHGSKIRYHENELYGSVETEFQQHADMIKEEEETEEEQPSFLAPQMVSQDPTNLLFAPPPRNEDMGRFFPPPEHARQMWFIFKDRVDPLLKIFHTTHKQDRFLQAVDHIDKQLWSTQAWMFATCLIVVMALSDEECIAEFGEAKNVLFGRLKYATQQVLIGSGLLRSSDTIVMQAYLMFLISVAHEYDAGTYWTMTGIALRLAQRAGLHRDQLSIGTDSWPWHAEMRRRLWWQVVMMDSRAAELTGLGASFSFMNWDTKIPLNVNDCELNIHMTELPPERVGATDMMYCLVGYEIGKFVREMRTTPSTSQAMRELQRTEQGSDELYSLIDELERRLEQKFLRYCDPLVPLHEMCLITARSAMASIRLMIHYPRHSAERSVELSPARRDMLFTNALRVIEYHNRICENKGTRKFAWSMTFRYPWHALVILLTELRVRPGGDSSRAWELVEQHVNNYPTLLKDNRKALHIACGSLAIKAWDARFQQLQSQGQPLPQQPEFITILRAKRDKFASAIPKPSECSITGAKMQNNANNTVSLADDMGMGVIADMGSLDPALATASNNMFDFSPENWSQWDDLILQNFELPQGIPETPGMFA
ncbi:MAG: hypothetical protein M1821_001299 [Bathelium mastoideum]|nr:MAG: hypothetical protein M1821_001299 [Bathelium mastoideum]